MITCSLQFALQFAASVLLLATLYGCGAEGTISSTSPQASSSSVAVSGTLSQGYVRGATVIADKIVSGSTTGNSQLDADEVSTTSSSSAQFSLSVGYANYVIVSTGGTYLNSKGVAVAAAPMMTPAPTSSESSWNLTPLTTLVVTQPTLKTQLDALGGWNTDIASPSGVPAQLLRVAKTVETYWHVTSQLTSSASGQLTALNNLATVFKEDGLKSDNVSLDSVAFTALKRSLSDTNVIPTTSDAYGMDTTTTLQTLKNALSKGVFQAIPDNNSVTVVEQDVVSDIETANDNATSTITAVVGKKPVLTEVAAVDNGTNPTPDYTFHSTYAGTISYSGDCFSDTDNATSGNNTIFFNTLAAGTHSNCTITVTTSSGKASDPLAVTAFTISAVKTDTTAPVLQEVLAVLTPTAEDSPSYIFSSTEIGKIRYFGSCSSSIINAHTDNNTITFNSLSPGTYSDCKLSVTDEAGNVSDNLSITAFEVIASSGGTFSVAFNPTISKINCEINTSNPSHLTVWAEVKDDGPLGDLRYLWYFSKLGWFGYKFESETTNPTVLYGYSASTTSGTLKVWVTDGKGLGGTSVFERKIAPGSC